jgi:hypothetical protein
MAATLVEFDGERNVFYQGCRGNRAANVINGSLKIRRMALRRGTVRRDEMPNGKRGLFPLLPLIFPYARPSRHRRERCARVDLYQS